VTVAVKSPFSDLSAAQLHYLKSQYLTSLEMIDQTETALRTQLDDVAKARTQVEELMQQLDHDLAAPRAPLESIRADAGAIDVIRHDVQAETPQQRASLDE